MVPKPLRKLNFHLFLFIGDEVGVFLEMEEEDKPDEIVAGRFLRLKVRLDIRKPLMRGVIVSLGEGEKERWCPLSYEFLPEFCCYCGIIGHTDRTCQMNMGKKAAKAFGRELRYIPPKRRPGGDGGRLGAWRSSLLGEGVARGQEARTVVVGLGVTLCLGKGRWRICIGSCSKRGMRTRWRAHRTIQGT
jgi:hypothetical protein